MINRIEKCYPRGVERWFSHQNTLNTTRIISFTDSQVAKFFYGISIIGTIGRSGPCSEISIGLRTRISEPLDGFVPDKDRCIAYGVFCITNSVLLQHNLSEQYSMKLAHKQ